MIRALHFLIYSNIWIATAAFSLTLFFYKIAEIKEDWIVLVFVFSSTLFIYNFQRIAKLKTGTAFSGSRLIWMKDHVAFSTTLSLISLIGSVLFFFLLDVRTLYILIPAGIISIFYVGKFLLKSVGGLRDVPFLKAYLVSFSWASVIAVLPALNARFEHTHTIFLLGVSIATFVFSLAIIFDLRDAEMDEKSKRTIPQLIGKRGTVILAVICLSFSMLIPLLLSLRMWPVSLLVICFGTFLIVRVSEKSSDFYYSFFLDGILILPGLITLFF